MDEEKNEVEQSIILHDDAWLLARIETLESNMKAVEHELEIAWDAINELQGVDPAKVGEPNG